MKRKPLVILAVIVAVVLLLIIAIPFFINANEFKPTLESQLTEALGRKVEVGNINLAILSGGVALDNLSVADDPAFSRSPFFTAKKLTVGVDLMPLIFSRRLQVRSFSVEEPEVTLLRAPSGAWNFSSLGGEKKTRAKELPSRGDDPPGESGPSVDKLIISGGRIRVGTAGSGGKARIYENVSLEAKNLSYTSQFPFKLTAQTPGKGELKVEGQAGPINRSDASLTPLDAKINVQHLDLTSTGFLDPSSGIGGIVNFTGNLNSDGRDMTSKGALRAEKLKLTKAGSPAQLPVDMDYDTQYDLRHQTGTLRQGDVHIGKALARLSGTYSSAGETPTVQMKLVGNGMPVPDLEGVLPAAGITLPAGASLRSGTLDANLAFTGPVDQLTITGPVNLSNARLAGYDLGSKLGALAAFAGLPRGADTDIQALSAGLRLDPSGIRADNLNMIIPAIGTLAGNGTISPSGQLNCRMLAKLTNSANPVSVLTSKFSPFGKSSSGIPFLIQGTTSAPIFLPDVGGMMGNMVKNPGNAAATPADAATSLLNNVLGRKKQPPQQ